MSLESYFLPFRNNIIGNQLTIQTEAGEMPVLYADWTASGRLYAPIESYISHQLGPYVANTHTETTLTGTTMTLAYHDAQKIIKKHVNANENDVILCGGGGMTTMINKFQRLLGVRMPDKWKERADVNEQEKPLVMITHMEHHSNQTTWSECEVTVEVIPPDADGLPCLGAMEGILKKYQDRAVKIGSFTACSNVTGIKTPFYEMSEIMHRHGGLCFVDFAASAPYVDMDMHPENPLQKLDAIFISPHKFLGGPGSIGVLIFDKTLYTNRVPDQPGGGTVSWTNPWGEHKFFEDIEAREDGGTPAFLQTIKAALAVKLKDAMGVDNIHQREQELTSILFNQLDANPAVQILEASQKNRLCIISFYVLGLHHNLIVKLLNDKFGVQSRGGCSCAGTYGHILLGVDADTSHTITDKIDGGDLTDKPGWVRVSLHPTNTNEEALFLANAINQVVDNAEQWSKEYQFDCRSGEWTQLTGAPEYMSINDFDVMGHEVKSSHDSKGIFSWFSKSA
jgi:selenocysteine lyase/cysteine desulfurase